MRMKCVLCHDKKGRRGCQLNSAQLICPPCCASIRRAECEGCGYYQASEAYQREKQTRNQTFITEIIPELEDRCHKALAFIERGNTARGQAMFEELRRAHPDYHSVLFGLGLLHAMKGQTDEAIACLERAVEIFPDFAEAHYNLGSSYRQNLDIPNAVKAYRAAIAVDDIDGEIGRLASERIDEIKAIMEKGGVSLATYIRNQQIYDHGFLALQDKRFQAAIDLFARVLATQKDHVQSYSNMGLAYALLGNRKKAIECLDKAIELDPGYEPATINRLSVLRLNDGESLPDITSREIAYYSEFKLQGKSYARHLLDELKAAGKNAPGPASRAK
ncbi:MAG: tetratricopeptide repeat protein [Betaproteobacteria bacterium]|nr:tetratricopeptide repeat protein [Betaproteobacteria bacterium]